MTTLRPEVALKRLMEMRQRRRRLRAWTGLFRWFCLAGLMVWISFGLDYTLSLPVGVRGFHIVIAAVLLVVGLKVFLLTARTPISEDRLAAEVESAAGNLDQSLITAIQLTREDNPRREFYSPMLLARTVRQAEEQMSTLRPGTLLSRSRAVRAFIFASFVIAPIFAGAALRPDLSRTFVERNIFLSTEDWPRQYFLMVVEPSSPETLLAVGDSLTVQAIRERGGGARARIEAYFSTADGSETREELPLERRGDDSFRRVFSNVSRDFRFRIHCGDFTSSWYEVGVRSRPRIEDITLTFDYPDYTGLDEQGAPPGILGGHLKVPVGTVVAFEATTSIEIREASRVETRRAGDGESRLEDSLTIGGGKKLSGSFIAEQNAFYYFRLVSEDGFENPTPIRYRIAVIQDQAPAVQILEPGQNQELSARAILKLAMHLTDDYGIASGELLFFLEGTSDAGEPLRRVPLLPLVPGSREVMPELELDLTDWGLQAGTRIEYFARATDAVGQIGESRQWLLTILDENELLRLLQDELTMMRERLQDTFELERDTRRGVEELEDHARTAGGTLPEESQPSLRHHRMSQERVNDRLEEGVGRFQELIDRVVENRLNDFQELPWVEELRDRLDALSKEHATPALEQLDELSEASESSEVTTEQLRDAADRLRGTERQLQALIDELEEWGDIQTIIRKLEDLHRSEVELENSLRERIRESLGEGATDPTKRDER